MLLIELLITILSPNLFADKVSNVVKGYDFKCQCVYTVTYYDNGDQYGTDTTGYSWNYYKELNLYTNSEGLHCAGESPYRKCFKVNE